MSSFVHVVMWRVEGFTSISRAERAKQVADVLRTMDGAIEGLTRLRVGTNTGPAQGNADVVMVAEFDDMSSFEGYDRHPAHLEVATWFAAQRGLTRMAVDFSHEGAK